MKYLIELVSYENQELIERLDVNKDELKFIIDKLYAKNIIKMNNGRIQFLYVGIAIVKNKPIFVLPKYINSLEEDKQKKHFKKIVELLNVFTSREKLDENSIGSISNNNETEENEFLSIIKFILDDYSEYGLYKNEIESVELNGNGDIDWNKTINQIDPLVFNNQWIYTDFITNKSIIDENKFITLLHGSIINECITLLQKYHLNLFFDCNEEFIENTLDNFDEEDVEGLENQIDKEIVIQFNDRKRRVLYAIKSYLNKRSGIEDVDVILFGTRNYKWVWEVVCGYVFDNEFVNKGRKSKYEVFGITSPKWIIGGNNMQAPGASDLEIKKNRLTPDILKTVFSPQGNKLLILDAKYYNIKFDIENKKVLGNPGIEDITKQYLYKTALKSYIKDNNIDDDVINAFLFPIMDKTNVQGVVKLDFMDEHCQSGIKLVMLNAEEVIEMYCNNKRYDIIKFIELVNKEK
ncbi:MAG: LlaJI family restriction endonuclease [Clostridium sp.]|uniref:LlaJI family restriction endonuclease n=1 Tax=Clostridium sp. TaxID=1506 RepID=UPI002A7619AA|nr:LlaJI family restriction endonuclease [Clostridium sp.]MDY2631705.1 LlaJI family restriction endonuclease [Clostridium sp.]